VIDMTGVFNLQGQLFLLMLLGAFFKRRKILGESFQRGLTELILDLLLPCSIIISFQVEFNRDIFYQTAEVLAVSVAIQILCWLLSMVLFRSSSDTQRPALQYGTICSNGGFLGTPVAEAIFGSQGVLLAAIYLIPQRVAMWSLGLSFFTKTDRQSVWKKILLNPCIDAVGIGMLLMLTQFQLPEVLGNTIHMVGNSNTGMCMFLIGMLMADASWRDFLDGLTLYYSAIRLVLIPLLVLLGCRLMHLDTLATNLSVILTAMPAGGTTAILAAKYHCNAEFAARCVTVSTVLSLAAIPLWCLVL
jgi:predicted permease